MRILWVFLAGVVVISLLVSRIFAQTSCPATKSQGDADCNGKVELIDYELWRREFIKLATTVNGDFDGNGLPDLIDYEAWRRTYSGTGGGGTTVTPPTATATTGPTTVTPPTSTPGGGGGGATGKFYIVGKDIVDPDGNLFRPVGANMSGIFFWTSPVETAQKAADAKRWGWNTIRLNGRVSEMGGSNYYGRASTWADYDAIVNAYTAQKIVSMIANHDATGTDPAGTEQATTAYFVAAANRYKDNPYVWFDIYNEPYSQTNSTQQTNFVAISKRILAAIRATGSENIVMPGAIDNGNDYTNWNAKMGGQIANGQCNVLFDIHPYFAFESSAEADKYVSDVQSAGLALIFAEWGIPHPPGALVVQGVPSLTYELTLNSATYAENNFKSKNVGILIWHGTNGMASESLRVTTSGLGHFDTVDNWTNPTNLTLAGQKLWAMAHMPALPKFTGNLAASNCPSAQ